MEADTKLLLDGLKAMVLGMGMVYLFLIIMIWVMQLSSKLVAPWAKKMEEANAPKPKRKPAAATGSSDRELANAAIEAVKKFREKNCAEAAQIEVALNGKKINVNVAPGANSKQAAAAPAAKPEASGNMEYRVISSPLPGTIVRIEVQEGDSISAGDVLAVVEAMKMETEIRAESDGTIKEILVSPKDVVAPEQPLFMFEVAK